MDNNGWSLRVDLLLKTLKGSCKDTQVSTFILVLLLGPVKAHIKLSIFRNIFLGIEKAVIIFSILEKIFSKNGN